MAGLHGGKRRTGTVLTSEIMDVTVFNGGGAVVLKRRLFYGGCDVSAALLLPFPWSFKRERTSIESFMLTLALWYYLSLRLWELAPFVTRLFGRSMIKSTSGTFEMPP
ncbi:hypothetical protein HAX54_014455 [Datura stramonium]|uniref:Uncharacterized protein n=1 Tax=Datura stramonium TaxID=4076 RepID=A0ABS8RJA1_DATST|nr:hypothetical protein [Datura stramonium]